MPYVENQIIHDADSHLMELPDVLDPYLDRRQLAAYRALPKVIAYAKGGWAEEAIAKHADPDFRAGDAENILLRKNQSALGAFLRADRPRAIDLLGFASQLVFTTYCLGNFGQDESGDLDLCYALATAHNRMMTDFCSAPAMCPWPASSARRRRPGRRSTWAARRC
jgi:hypothetical protein